MKHISSSIFKGVIYFTTLVCTIVVTLVFLNIFLESLPFFKAIGIREILAPQAWKPLSSNSSYALLFSILGTLYVSILAVVVAVPIGLGCACYLCFCTSSKGSQLVLMMIDLVAGIPSVIFGFIGLTVLLGLIEDTFHLASGESVLAGGLLLAVMLLPYMITSCYETLKVSKSKYYLSALSMGVSKWMIINDIILKDCRGSILAHTLLALGRAMGETMAVMMVIGNAPIFPKLLGRAQTIPSLIALEMGTATYRSMHYYALYGAAFILLVLLICIQFIAYRIRKMSEKE